MNNPTSKANGIKQSIRATIVNQLVNIADMLASLDPSNPSEIKEMDELSIIEQRLISTLIDLERATICNLNNDPETKAAIAHLTKAAKDTKKQVASLAAGTKKISEFNRVLDGVAKVVSGMVKLAT